MISPNAYTEWIITFFTLDHTNYQLQYTITSMLDALTHMVHQRKTVLHLAPMICMHGKCYSSVRHIVHIYKNKKIIWNVCYKYTVLSFPLEAFYCFNSMTRKCEVLTLLPHLEVTSMLNSWFNLLIIKTMYQLFTVLLLLICMQCICTSEFLRRNKTFKWYKICFLIT